MRERTELAVPIGRELGDEDVAVLRWAIDHGLKETDSWEGYEVSEQYTLKSLRYQLNWIQWSLALAHAAATPAYSGVSEIAQRNLISRMTRPEVWSYWRKENLWGNLRNGDDPIGVDNIMFSGYLLAMLGSYRVSTGSTRFVTDGALTFGRHSYSEPTVAAAVQRNLQRSPYTLFACEPGLIFPLCNSVAMAGLSMTDPDAAARIWPSFHRQLVTEFTFTDGLIPFFTWTRGGASTYASRSPSNTAVVGSMLSSIAPDFADRMQQRLFGRGADLPTAEYAPRGTDWGTGKRSHVTDLAFIAMLAGANGDTELHDATVARAGELLELTTVNGVAAYEAASVTGNGMLAVARFSRNRGWQRLADGIAHDGPRLADAAYPDVRVNAATSDGTALHLRLRSGGDATLQKLRLVGLEPNQTYILDGRSTFESGADGAATVQVKLRSSTSSHTVSPRK